MPGLLPHIDPDGLLEFSVVYTDRALNHMSKRFGGVMTDISRMLKSVYGAHSVALVPGSGTFGMESVARQFAQPLAPGVPQEPFQPGAPLGSGTAARLQPPVTE